jgi:hypothetical protein
METDNQQTLIERLERLEERHVRLERSYRITKLVPGVAVVACVAVSTLPMAESASTLGAVSAKAFNVVNPPGRTVATLGPTGDGNVMTFFDSAVQKVVPSASMRRRPRPACPLGTTTLWKSELELSEPRLVREPDRR